MRKIIFLSLILGIITGFLTTNYASVNVYAKELSYYSLLALIFLVGLEIGQNRLVWIKLQQIGARALLLPASVIVGSLLGGLLAGWILGFNVFESLSLASGMGYYSLSSIMLSKTLGVQMGIYALAIDLSRELATFIATPLLARWSYLFPITIGGATVMDTTLPIITRFTSTTNAVLAIISGGVLSIVVPLLLQLFSFLANWYK